MRQNKTRMRQNIREAAPPTGEYVSLVHEVSRQQDHAPRSALLEKCPQVAPRVRIHSCGRLIHKNNLKSQEIRHSSNIQRVATDRRQNMTHHKLLQRETRVMSDIGNQTG